MTFTYSVVAANGTSPLHVEADTYHTTLDGRAYVFTDAAGVVAEIPRRAVTAIHRRPPADSAKKMTAAADEIDRIATILETPIRDCTDADHAAVGEFVSFYKEPLPNASVSLRGVARYLRRSGEQS